MPRFTEWSLPFRFSDQNSVYISHISHVCYMSCPVHLILLDKGKSTTRKIGKIKIHWYGHTLYVYNNWIPLGVSEMNYQPTQHSGDKEQGVKSQNEGRYTKWN